MIGRGLLCVVVLLVPPVTVMAESVEGQLRWSAERELGLPVSGIVADVRVQAGDQVAAGAELLRLDPRPFEARRALAQAELERILPAFEEAQDELERAQDLLERTVTSEADFRLAEIAAKQTQASLAAAQARLDLSEWELAASQLRATTPTRILAVDIHPGQAVANRDRVRPLLRVADAERIEAQARISAPQAQALHAGDRIEVRQGRDRYSAEVVAIEYRGDASAASRYLLRVRWAIDPTLRPDLAQSVRLELP